MFYYIIYTSTPTAPVDKETVESITSESIKWNSKHGITGMLLCLEDKYFQFLEGEEKDILEVFDMIKGDSRHTNVAPRIKGFSEKRVFSEWNMGSWMLSNDQLEELTALKDLKEYINDPINSALQSKKYIAMMHNLLSTWLDHEPERAKRLKGE